MTEENQKPKQRTQMNLDEALQANKETTEKALADSPFVKIQDHETIKLPFSNPPVIYRTTAEGTDKKTGQPYKSEQLEFELRTQNSVGQTKTWSIGAGNKIVPEILALLKAGVYDIPVHREGEGTSTKYSIAKERSV